MREVAQAETVVRREVAADWTLSCTPEVAAEALSLIVEVMVVVDMVE